MYIEPIISNTADSNIYIINKKILIDAGMNGNLTINRLSNCIELSNITNVILTHSHYDHFGALPKLLSICQPKIGICHKDAESLYNLELSASNLFGIDEKVKFKLDILYKEKDLVFIDKDPFTGKEEYLQVIQTPGHTKGSICLYSKEEKILFSGDTIFSYGIGRTDFNNSSPSEMTNSIKKLISLDIKTIYPGHGNIIKQDVSSLLSYLHTLSLKNDY